MNTDRHRSKNKTNPCSSVFIRSPVSREKIVLEDEHREAENHPRHKADGDHGQPWPGPTPANDHHDDERCLNSQRHRTDDAWPVYEDRRIGLVEGRSISTDESWLSSDPLQARPRPQVTNRRRT